MSLRLPAAWKTLGLLVSGALVVCATILAIRSALPTRNTAAPTRSRSPDTETHAPPWIYGQAKARYTIVEYADLECEFCREYFPVLKRWIEANPEVNWQWNHLPLQMHEPAATQSARLAECAGEAGGNSAFWTTVAWVYQHTRGNGTGLPADERAPAMSDAVQSCLNSKRPDAVIQTQISEGAREQISATPTLRLLDRKTGRTILLSGPIEGDALSSAIDWLASPEAEVSPSDEEPNAPLAPQ
jgi:protein-disulfide isomerase